MIAAVLNNQVAEKDLTFTIWSLTEKVEYASAIYSIVHDLTDFFPKLPQSPPEKDLRRSLEHARESIGQAIQEIERDPRLSYEKMKGASIYLKRIGR